MARVSVDSPARPPDLKSEGAVKPMASARWNDLGKRVGSAMILAPLALACLWFGRDAWAVLVAIGAAGCAAEWATLCGAQARRWPGLLLPLGMAAIPLVTYAFGGTIALVLALLLTLAGILLFGPGRQSLWLKGGFLYLAPAAIALILLRHHPVVGRWDMFFLVLIIWASDIGAYVVGRLVGGPKLAPAISPGKTWSGALGGLFAAALVGLLVATAVGGRLPVLHCVGVAMLLGCASQIGDLLESGFKRHFGVKDSGRSIPGHGGLLDRLDGMLTAAPVAALIALTIGEGLWLWQ